ncbi:MAG: hypothetical protein AAGH15_09170 [Myxococcota bacterium]
MAEPITAIVAIVGGSVASLLGLGSLIVRKQKREFLAREARWAALAARLGATFSAGRYSSWKMRFGAIALARDHAAVRIECYTVSNGDNPIPYTRCQASWAHGAGPRLAITKKTFRHRVGDAFGKEDLALGDRAFDAHYAVRCDPSALGWLVRAGLGGAALGRFLVGFPTGELRSDARTLTLAWPGHEADEARLLTALELVLGVARAGLEPFRAVASLPDGAVTWPAGPLEDRSAPVGRLAGGGTVATLRFVDGAYRLEGPVASTLPPFAARFEGGVPTGEWPRGVLEGLGGELDAMGDADVSVDGDRLALRFVRPPNRRALQTGTRILARAAGAPGQGAFR